MFKRILIANRGEIAVRVIRACRELGIKTVAVYSEADRKAPHIQLADYAYFIGGAKASESYLNQKKILDVAVASGAEAIHPGYGFLAENTSFAEMCGKAGVVFIGPPADAVQKMGDKLTARKTMIDSGVPVVPGTETPVKNIDEGKRLAKEIGYPILVKASAGGGGKGMRLVNDEKELESAIEGASREAEKAFGNAAVYFEKYLEEPHHIEFQIMADSFGNTIHLQERECSMQRRHQKVVEETPSPIMTPELREKMGEVAVQAAKAVNYVNAGTIEFLVDKHRNFYFLEMNTRLQVEHPITELITDIDLVKLQIAVAAGEKLPIKQEEVKMLGHAIECRIYAEDVENDFLPSPGVIKEFILPSGPGVRNDEAAYPGYEVPMHYDPMIAKLACWGQTREEAIRTLQRALDEYTILGIKSSLPFHRALVKHPQFQKGDYTTHFLNDEMPNLLKDIKGVPKDSATEEALLVAAGIHSYRKEIASRERPQGRVSNRRVWTSVGRQEALRTL
ncbi:acetyl-CoA carboxylase biotin carboxylase subunit [Bdellovibrionota bacterium]